MTDYKTSSCEKLYNKLFLEKLNDLLEEGNMPQFYDFEKTELKFYLHRKKKSRRHIVFIFQP